MLTFFLIIGLLSSTGAAIYYRIQYQGAQLDHLSHIRQYHAAMADYIRVCELPTPHATMIEESVAYTIAREKARRRLEYWANKLRPR